MAPKDENFTREVKCLLIQYVQQCPMLWDVNCKEYKRNDLKRGLWHRIAQSLGPQFTGDAVKKRFENMASTYRDNNRRVRESLNRCSGKESIDNLSSPSTSCDSLSMHIDLQSRQDTPVSVYYDENTQKFTMIPVNNSHLTSLSTCTIPSDHESNVNCTRPIGKESLHSSQVAHEPSDVESWVPIPVAAFSPPPRSASAPSGFKRPNDDHPLYVKRGSSKKSSVDDAVEAIKSLAKQEPPPSVLDHFEVLGSYIASRLRNMSPEDQQHYEMELLRVLSQRRQP